MRLKIEGQNFELDKDNPLIEGITTITNEALKNKDLFFSHFIINGVEVYENFELYIEEHLADIEEIEVITLSVKQFVEELLISAEQYLKRALPEIRSLSEELYQGQKDPSWDKSLQMIDGLQWIYNLLSSIDRTDKKPVNWDNILTRSISLEEVFRQLQEAMENRDELLLADLIGYELMPLLEKLNEEITQTINEEGIRHDFS